MAKKATVLVVPDMTCGHCEMSVREALDGFDEVEVTRADHVKCRVEVVHVGAKVGDEQFGRAVEDAGYTLRRRVRRRLQAEGERGRCSRPLLGPEA